MAVGTRERLHIDGRIMLLTDHRIGPPPRWPLTPLALHPLPLTPPPIRALGAVRLRPSGEPNQPAE